MSKAIIFTDGSSRGNPGPGGWGAIVGYEQVARIGKGKKVKELGGGNKRTTNNRMELTAVIEGLEYIKKKAPEADISVFTDSEYVKKGATEWVKGWQANNWRTKANADVLNKDLWQKIVPLVAELSIKWNVIAGHSGIPANERCDVIATTFADGKEIELYDGDYTDYKVSFEVRQHSFPRSTSGAMRAKGTKAYSYVSSIKGIVKVHETWADCEARVKGEPNARFRKALSKQDENAIIKDFSHR